MSDSEEEHSDKQFKIVIIGDGASGKVDFDSTSILVLHAVAESPPTPIIILAFALAIRIASNTDRVNISAMHVLC